jgi:hypothetical protein
MWSDFPEYTGNCWKLPLKRPVLKPLQRGK